MKDSEKLKKELDDLIARVERAGELIRQSQLKMEDLRAAVNGTEAFLRQSRQRKESAPEEAGEGGQG